MVLTIYIKSQMFVKIFAQETNDFRMIERNSVKLFPPLGSIQNKVFSVDRITQVKIDLGVAHNEHKKRVPDVPERRQVGMP